MPKLRGRRAPGLVDTVVTEWDPATGDVRLHVRDPRGAISESHGDQGQYTIRVEGAGGVGSLAEGRIAAMVRDALRAQGLIVEILDGQDEGGDDRKLNVAGTTFVLQVTIAPNSAPFWREARISSASTQVPEHHAIQWLRAPISNKAFGVSRDQLKRTVLAIDVTHAGVIANSHFVNQYLREFGPPGTEFGFASVWVVGPNENFCCRLGPGFP
jgi:hypothetical protein